MRDGDTRERQEGLLDASAVLSRPGLSWTPAEIDAVCNWLFELPRYRQLLFWGLRILGPYAVAEDAEDAVAEFFQQRLRQVMRRFDPAKAPFWHYLLVCFQRFCQRLRIGLEKRRPPMLTLVRLENVAEEASPELIVDSRFDLQRGVEGKELADSVRRGLKVLPPQFSSVLVLSYQGKTTAQIARRLGISETNAKVRLFRARRLLRELIRENGATR
jgi:RNA polymerase sigma factor (sigma-70 family)